MTTEFKFSCPEDPTDQLVYFTVFHADHVVCHRHQLKSVYCGMLRTYPDDTPDAIASWERSSARVAQYRSIPFPLSTNLSYYCPEDIVDTLAHYNIFRTHHLVCHRHQLKHVYATMPRLSPHDTLEDLAYWERLEAQLAEYQSVPFPELTDFEYSCPEDPTDELAFYNIFHSHYVVCHRHQLIEFYYGGSQFSPDDTPDDIVYWEQLEAQLARYRKGDFPFGPPRQGKGNARNRLFRPVQCSAEPGAGNGERETQDGSARQVKQAG